MKAVEPTLTADNIVRLKLVLRGTVQGVGFRPFVFRLAQELHLAGWVRNSSEGVFLEVEGSRTALEEFRLRLETEKPPHSLVKRCEASWLDALGYDGFVIRDSDRQGAKTALVPPDTATCPDCLREIFDSTNRRHRYPFTNCTHCGPRFTIIEALPYDRANTTMRGFRMCAACEAEYSDPTNRRFHAQPNACPVCGPKLELWSGDILPPPISNGGTCECAPSDRGTTLEPPHVVRHSSTEMPNRIAQGDDALLAAAQFIRDGSIVAVKGIGGFHLFVDARKDAAILRLRDRKHREAKPFALMFPTLKSVTNVCEVSLLEERLLTSSEAPIVLLRRLESRVCDFEPQIAHSVAPGNPNLGVMLPSNPLHHLLIAELGFPVVATSGNRGDEPICTDEFEALARLRDVADVFLVHNRPIVRHADDSIVRVMLDRETVLRRARGYAPLPIELKSAVSNPVFQTVLAVGAHFKSSVALAIGEQVFLSQHIGDLETEQANNAFHRMVDDLPRLFDVQPELVSADAHPDYLSTKYAVRAGRTGTPQNKVPPQQSPSVIKVQHHIAHVLSCLAENEVAPPALGVAWDGTGLGTDGAIWGGEFFHVTDQSIERIAHWRPFRLPGGDTAAREPRRAALGLLHELADAGNKSGWHRQHSLLRTFSSIERTALETMLTRGLNAPLCCSVGRLFDAVASLVGLRQRLRFEGEAAMELEFAAENAATDAVYDVGITDSQLQSDGTEVESPMLCLDWGPMIEAILADIAGGTNINEISAKFHNSLAEAIVTVAEKAGLRHVALSGGCFQNRYLTERAVKRLRAAGFQAYWHQCVPTNDGGIALGQVVAARRESSDPRGMFPRLERPNNEPRATSENLASSTLIRPGFFAPAIVRNTEQETP